MNFTKQFLLVAFAVLFFSVYSQAQITSANSGDWGVGATWVGGLVPGATDNVVVDVGHTVTLNTANAVCNNLTIDGKLRFAIDGTVTGITVNGSITINSGGILRVETRSPAGAANSFVEHLLTLKGNLTNNGTLDFRGGSNGAGTANGVLLSLEGTSNSTIGLTSATYQSAVEEFNSITINKTGSAKVILQGGNLYMSNNSTVGSVILTLTKGIVETGSNHWVLLKTGSTGIVGGLDDCFFNGIFGRGISNGGGLVEPSFPVGEGTKYRPISISFNAPVNGTGHYVWVHMLSGNANTGSSVFSGGIDKVSEVRYYEVGYLQNNGSAAAMPAFRLSPTYSTDDGVNAGNTDLRVAYSSDNRTTWNGIGPTNHTTNLTSVPNTIASDSLVAALSISTGTSIFVSLARATGTTTNPLPVELISFSASSLGNNVELTWTTATEVNNSGFEIERSFNSKSFEKVGFVQGSGSTTENRYYSFTDNSVSTGQYTYRLKQIDLNGTFSYSNEIMISLTSPEEFGLEQNYPNPFNPTTVIKYQLAENSFVTLKVYDLLGKELRTLVNEYQAAGSYSVDFNIDQLDKSVLSSGIYVYQLKAGEFSSTKKMILLR